MIDSKSMYWILHKAVLGDRIDEARQIITSLGDTALNGEHYSLDYLKDVCYTKGNNVSGLITLSLARDLRFYTPQLFYTSYYMQWCHKYFVNADCVYVPFWKLDTYLYKHDAHERLFIKPNSGFKPFTGFCGTREEIQKELNGLRVSSEQMCLVTKARDIQREFRFFIVDGEIVTQTEYSWDEEIPNTDQVPSDIMRLAQEIVPQMQMDNYTLDLCYEWKDRVFVAMALEVNCIYTSGTYGCDLVKLLTAMRKYELGE